MQQRNHFFGSRLNGVNNSDHDSAWRYGKGNVFSPTADHSETANAKANVDAVMSHHLGTTEHPGVILVSQYGKGISVVDDDFLQNDTLTRDNTGRIIINGDGLFTTKKNIPLLNKSGDAHAIIFESKEAVGIIVGAWKCLGKDIIGYMLDHFSKLSINYHDITVHIGPGLGNTSYSIGKPTLDDLKKTFGEDVDLAVTLKTSSNGVEKYILNVHQLMLKHAEKFGFHVNASESHDTFDKHKWKAMKAEALATKNPHLPINYYQSVDYFSARLYVRADRLARRIAVLHNLPTPELLTSLPQGANIEDIKNAGSQGRYNETGRCLNGVMK